MPGKPPDGPEPRRGTSGARLPAACNRGNGSAPAGCQTAAPLRCDAPGETEVAGSLPDPKTALCYRSAPQPAFGAVRRAGPQGSDLPPQTAGRRWAAPTAKPRKAFSKAVVGSPSDARQSNDG